MPDELALGQERLARTLARARASEDRELANRVRDEGYQLVHQLNGLLRMARLHSLDNQAFDQPVRESARSLARLTELLGMLHLVAVDDQIYLNEIRMRLDERSGGHDLGQELLRHELGGLRFHVAPTERELRNFVACFAGKPAAHEPRAALRAAVAQAGVSSLELLGPFRARLGGDAVLSDTPAVRLARRAQVVREAFEALTRGRHFSPLPARRAVAEMLAGGLDGSDLISEPPGFPPYVLHALRVSQLAVLLGREIGLAPAALQDLGVAALLHDVGYADRAARPGFDQHPAAGALLLLRQRGFSVSKARRVRAVLGHHSAPHATDRRPSLMARVLCIVEDYDTLVRTGTAPTRALAGLCAAGGARYDAVLMQAFVNALGPYPPGCQVILPDGRPALVVYPGRGPEGFGRPIVAVGARAATGPVSSAERLDLARLKIDPHPLDAPAARSTPPSALPLAGPVSQGVPLRLLHDTWSERRSGVLRLLAVEEWRELRFVAGRVVAAGSSTLSQGLARFLEQAGLSPVRLEWIQAQADRAGQALGRTAVEAGILETHTLEEALRAQALAVVGEIAAWEEGEYRFVGGDPPSDADVATGISTEELLVAAVRALADPDVVRFALGDLGRVPQRVAARDALLLQLAGAPSRALLAQIDGRISARHMLRTSGLPSDEAQRALLTLLALGLVDWRTPD